MSRSQNDVENESKTGSKRDQAELCNGPQSDFKMAAKMRFKIQENHLGMALCTEDNDQEKIESHLGSLGCLRRETPMEVMSGSILSNAKGFEIYLGLPLWHLNWSQLGLPA